MMVTTWTDPAYESIAHLLASRTGLVFTPNRIESFEAAVRRAVGRSGVAGATGYLRLLESDKISMDELVAEVTVGETYFFRDPALFEHIRHQVLPEIIGRIGTARPIRLWSGGCASGEEAYSLAILIEEAHLADHAHLLATDISRTALSKARAAVYGAWSLRASDPAFIERYFNRVDDRLVLDPRFRTRVSFEYLNMAIDSYPSMTTGTWGMDLILCRNVMIYLDRGTVERVARRLLECLADGGLLVTGPSDPWIAEIVPCETVATPVGTFYRRSKDAARVEPRSRGTTPEPPPLLPLSGVETPVTPSSLPREPAVIPGEDVLEQSRDAFARGRYDQVLEMTGAQDQHPELAALRVKSLANLGGPVEAEREAEAALALHPLSAELHFLRGVILMSLGRDDEAARSVRGAIYLDRSLAVAHFTLGSILRRNGDLAGARRAYRNALDLCLSRHPGELVPLSDGESAGRLAEAAQVQIGLLEGAS